MRNVSSKAIAGLEKCELLVAGLQGWQVLGTLGGVLVETRPEEAERGVGSRGDVSAAETAPALQPPWPSPVGTCVL